MDIVSKIKDVIKESGCYLSNIKDEDRINEDLGFDSLGLVGLIVNIENVFDIEIDEFDLNPADLVTFGDMCRLVKKYVEGENQVGGMYA